MENKTRNFCIIAHIDHGKSTLADRFLEASSKKIISEQTLDRMDLERERGITIKLKSVSLQIPYNNDIYTFNLIDTPGHVDFSYEVSRSLAACEGAILLVDSVKGVQAQTIANTYKAIDQKLTIIPVINKIDLISAEVERVEGELINIFGFKKEEILKISAKTGLNFENIVEAVVKKIPPPDISQQEFKALIFDSFFDNFQGAIAAIKVFGGSIKKGQKVTLINAKKDISVEEVGIFVPERLKTDELKVGDVGYIVVGEKDLSMVRVGDTVARIDDTNAFEGYKEPQQVVYKGIYPVESDNFEGLREALTKLHIEDASFTYEPDSFGVLGQGFKCGFLGNLHSEIIETRVVREFDIEVYTTPATVKYLKGDQEIIKPSDMILPSEDLLEPWVSVNILVSEEYMGNVMKLVTECRGEYINMSYISSGVGSRRIELDYNMPLIEVVSGFFDELKSVSSGYASLDYQLIGMREVRVNKLEVIIAGEEVEALSRIVIESRAQRFARELASKLKDSIPRQQFAVSIQIAIGGKILAREDVRAFRKDVTQKLYGGDHTRRDKLLKKQKAGKKKMKSIGKINISPDVFRKISSIT